MFRRRPTAVTPTPQEAVVIDMGDLSGNSNSNGKKKKLDTLFGPNIGVVANGPAWTEPEVNEKDPGAFDELTPDVVKTWIAKSKEVSFCYNFSIHLDVNQIQSSQATTTLQALVNLKRPTLRLSPLSTEGDEASHDHHGLEFEYDCDAPKCGIYVTVLLPHEHPDAPSSQSQSQSAFARLLVFETVVDGGFGRLLKLEEGAMLDLDRFDRQEESTNPADSTAPSAAPNTATAVASDSPATDRKSRRFTNFHFRKRGAVAAGPALAVVDAAPSATADNTATAAATTKSEDTGVKVHIRLVALDAASEPLSSRNEQGTYLHVVRMGAGEEDTRPWVVKVVKREATIGPHTFQLHEIYGLSAQSSAPVASPPAPAPAPAPAPGATDGEPEHTYPPTTPVPPPVPVMRDDEPSSECLLCLSSAREVVLLPCRHLVACKECALNMVEFGAGGSIVQPEAETAAPGADAAAANGTASANAIAAEAEVDDADVGAIIAAHLVGMPTHHPTTGRRKRKAKGWFCPVCRQRMCCSSYFPLCCFTFFILTASHVSSSSVHVPFADNDHATRRTRERLAESRFDIQRWRGL